MPIDGGVEQGWISKYALQANALAADSWGRQAMEDGFLIADKCNAAFKIRCKDQFLDVSAAAANAVRNAEDLSAALPITFTIDAQPDVPRTLTWALAHTNITAFTLIFVGVDAKGKAVTETFSEASGWSGETSAAFARVTSITLSARTGTGATDTCNIGIGSKLGLSNPIAATSSVYKVTKNKADYPPASYTVDAVNDTVDVSTGGAIVADDDFCMSYETPMNAAS